MSTTTTSPVARSALPRGAELSALASLPAFRSLLRRRSRFVFAASAFLLTFNLLQPVLSVFTRILDHPAFGRLTWGWVYAFAQFLVPLMILHLYTARAQRFDAEAAGLVASNRAGDA